MDDSSYAYLFLEIAAILTICIFASPFSDWRVLFKKVVIVRMFLIFGIWVVIDKIAIGLSIGAFPPPD